ncbi:choice-of-anchor L domain-containing protein, partial [Anabaena sp. AL93]|uniref:choice-of-anchor L domain-containing protein n=1 Tax=Anabaena sp. AL93 TaxID=1678133 RepID=UPI0025C3FCAF
MTAPNTDNLVSSLIGSGVEVTNAEYTGDSRAAGIFNDPSLGIGIDSGIILSTGDVANIYGPNNSDSTGTAFATDGDTDLNGLVSPSATRDAAVLEFDFTPTESFISFQYVFASEEYNEYVNSSFNDVFGFFITDSQGNKQNIAVIPGTNTPIAVNNVNLGSNSGYYRNNDPSDYGFGNTPFNIGFDGSTTPLTAVASVTPGQTYHFKLAIADNSDSVYDSAVFIKNGGFISTPLVSVNDAANTYQETPITINVLGNDIVPSGETPSISNFQQVSDNGGSVTLSDNGTPDNLADDQLVYTPPTGFSGVDQFEYTLADSQGNTSIAQVSIQVQPTYQQYNFTYTYGNGDSYSGYGYAAQGTYTVGQVLDGYTNETGNPGYYTIDSVDNAGTGNSNYVYVTSYTDGDTGYGTTNSISSEGYSGLGSEYGYAYNSAGGGDYFSNSNEADLLHQQYTFTYTYGNGDSYSGYGYAAQGTYTVGQVLDGYTNETGNPGYYTIDSVDNTSPVNSNYGYVTSYTDGDTGYGTTNSISSWGIAGLGSESGYAYNSAGGGDYFSNSNEADLINQQYTFTYTYGNGDSYSGYGYAAQGTYTVDQVLDGYTNETGNPGYYTINSVDKTDIVNNNYVYVTSYTDGDTGYGSANYAYGNGYSGLGSESGYAYNSAGGGDYFSNSNEADLINQQYTFTYTYGNGDSYSGYGYAAQGTYTVGQVLDGYTNETGNPGYYTINSVDNAGTGNNNYVYVTSYTDGDTGYGTTNSISSWGYSGLGSEYGSAYNANYSGDTGFNSYYEADLPAVLQVRLNLLADNNGIAGEIISNDQVGLNRSFFVEIQVADLRGNAAGVNGLGLNLAWDGLILESIDTPFDPTNIITANFPLLQDGTVDNSSGLINNLSGGSLPAFELGQAIGVNQLERFALLRFQTENSTGTYYFTTTVDSAALADDNPYYSLDVETSQPILIGSVYNQYNFTYNYGNGDSYTGYVYAVEGTYTAGQTIGGIANETGYTGQYTIDSIASTTLDSFYNGHVYVTSYTDGDTGFGAAGYLNIGAGYSGLGSEYGYAYDANGYSFDPYFSNSAEADILANQKYNFTYSYGNGDSYSGYG